MAIAFNVFYAFGESSKGAFSPVRTSRLLRRHESKAPPRNDVVGIRLLRRHETKAPPRNDGLEKRLFQSHKVLLRNDGEKSHCEAMLLPFMAVAIALTQTVIANAVKQSQLLFWK